MYICGIMDPIYLPFGKFTAVGTPHVLEQTINRTGSPMVEFLGRFSVNLSDTYDKMDMEQCHWLPVGNFLLYIKKKYNHLRRRYELEMISLTPSNFKKTRNKDFAEGIKVKPSSDTSFPDWFDD